MDLLKLFNEGPYRYFGRSCKHSKTLYIHSECNNLSFKNRKRSKQAVKGQNFINATKCLINALLLLMNLYVGRSCL
jgi:hypothetical protein